MRREHARAKCLLLEGRPRILGVIESKALCVPRVRQSPTSGLGHISAGRQRYPHLWNERKIDPTYGPRAQVSQGDSVR
jgi:hypothetical protein